MMRRIETVDPATERDAGGLGLVVAVAASHVESWVTRFGHFLRPIPADYYRGVDRRRNPRTCPLCGGPMQRDGKRPPRDSRANGGQIKRLPGEILEWFRCGRCHQSQIGVWADKSEGRRAA